MQFDDCGTRERQTLARLQGYRCAICKGKYKLVLDHNHDTGEVRGMLCNACNLGLGCFKDNVLSMSEAIAYLYADGFQEEGEEIGCRGLVRKEKIKPHPIQVTSQPWNI